LFVAEAIQWRHLLDSLPRIDASADPDDNDLPAIAVTGSADYLVPPGDKQDLLARRSCEVTKILSSATVCT